jgi:hypothetical protein
VASKQPAVLQQLIAQQSQVYLEKLHSIYAEYDAYMLQLMNSFKQQGFVTNEQIDQVIGQARSFEPVLNGFETTGQFYAQHGLNQIIQQVATYRAEMQDVIKAVESKRTVMPPPPKDGGYTSPIWIPDVQNTTDLMRALTELRGLLAKGTPYWLAVAEVRLKYPNVKGLGA